MKRNLRRSEIFFLIGLGSIFLFMLVHDWIPLGSLNDINGIQAEHTTRELLIMTMVQTLSILVVLSIAVIFAGKRYPLWAKLWLVIHLSFILYGAISAWWIPYFFGSDEGMVERYSVMFGNTHAFLPVMNGIVPNTIHVMFHLTLLVTWMLAIFISVTRNKKKVYFGQSGKAHSL